MILKWVKGNVTQNLVNRIQKKLNTTQTQKIQNMRLISPKIWWTALKKSWNPHKMLLIKIVVIKNTNSYNEMKKKFKLHILFVEGVGET